MAKPYAREFYNSIAWRRLSKEYWKKVGGLCERCKEKGIYTPGEIVHHKVHITPSNINDPNITLNENNLQLVCRYCHEEIHKGRAKRYKVDEFGRVEDR